MDCCRQLTLQRWAEGGGEGAGCIGEGGRDLENLPRRQNRLTPEQVWEDGWGGGGELDEIDGKAKDREGVWG